MTEKQKFVLAVAVAAVADCFRDLSLAQQEMDNATELRSAATSQMQMCVAEWRAAGVKTLGHVGKDERATALSNALKDLRDEAGEPFYATATIANMLTNFRAALKTGKYVSNASQAKSRAAAKKKSDTQKAIDMMARLIKFVEDHEDFKFNAPKVLGSLRDTHRTMQLPA